MLDVYVYGSGECDQLGLGDSDILESKNPKKVPILNIEPNSKVYKICCGGMHTLVLTTMGKVFSWGCNDDGALGRSGIDNQPLIIDTIKDPMTNITAGDSFSIAYNTELNLIYQWGAFRNNSGKIADPITEPVLLDKKLFGNKSIKKIISGSNHALAIAAKSLYGWGDCELGQIGKLSKPNQSVEWSLKPHAFETKEVLDVFTGCNHSFSISKKGKRHVFKAWGLNNYGQLGLRNKTNTSIPTEVEFFVDIKVKYATGGDHHSMVLTEDGEIYSWGRNDEGQCGILNENNRDNEELSFCIDMPKKIETFLKENQINTIQSSMNFNYASSHKMNKVYSWGMGESYVLGNKKDDNILVPNEISKEFFFNKNVHQISLGSCHVAVCLSDPTIEKLPELEFDSEAARIELKRRRFEENKIKPTKKRSDTGNIDITSTSKRNTKKVNYNETNRTKSKKVSQKNEVTEDSQDRNKDKEILTENVDNNIITENPEKKTPVKKKKNTKKK